MERTLFVKSIASHLGLLFEILSNRNVTRSGYRSINSVLWNSSVTKVATFFLEDNLDS